MINPNEMHDRDGNTIRRGMAVMSGGDQWVVAHVQRSRFDWAVILDRVMADGRTQRLLVGRKRLYCVHVIGYQIPQVF